jgi:hypothetical protein
MSEFSHKIIFIFNRVLQLTAVIFLCNINSLALMLQAFSVFFEVRYRYLYGELIFKVAYVPLFKFASFG